MQSVLVLVLVARWTVVCQLASWFNAYCLVRTYAGCLEALAAVAGVYHILGWEQRCCGSGEPHTPRGRGSQQGTNSSTTAVGHLRVALLAAGLGVALRPPSMLLWLPVGAP